MGLLEELLDVLSSLNAQRFRAALTLLGVILGVGTLVFLSSLLAGSQAYLQHGIQQANGEDIISISPRGWDDRDQKTGPALDRFDTRALATDPALAKAGVLTRLSRRVQAGEANKERTWVVGTLPSARDIYHLDVARGRFLGQGDLWSLESVAVLGPEAATKLLPGEADPVGKEVLLDGQRFRVIGLLSGMGTNGGGWGFSWNGSAVVSEPVYQMRFARNLSISELVVKAPEAAGDKGAIAQIAHTVDQLLLNRHHGVSNYRIKDPSKDNPGDQIVAMIVLFLEVSVAAVCLGVGGINIMNIMVVTVAQRTREIGIRRALGATKWSIQRVFLAEAILLATTGGLLGLMGGNLLAWLLSLGLTRLWGYWPYVATPLPMVLGFVAAVATGAVFGWYPARRAAELPPVMCLRAE